VPSERTAGRPMGSCEMDIEALPYMLRVDEAAALLRISRSRAYEEVGVFQRTHGADGLPSIRIGRCLRVPKRRYIARELFPHIAAITIGDHTKIAA
jgi:hypothetical protein